MPEAEPLAALIGLDWADQHHDVAVQVGDQVEHSRVAHTPEALQAWVTGLRARFPGGRIGIALEQSRGPVIHALMAEDQLVLSPINPRSLPQFREALRPSGAKDDRPDAELLLELLRKHRDRLRPWRPEAAELRALRRLVESRRRFVDQRTKLVQQLTAALNEYFPQLLDWVEDLGSPLAGDLLLTWPTLQAIQRARPTTLRKFFTRHHVRRPELLERRLAAIATATPLTQDRAVLDPSVLVVRTLVQQLQALAPSLAAFDTAIAANFAQQADADLFESLPGSGPVLAPRLLALFGTDRSRFAQAAELQQWTGIAPVTERSGQRTVVHWRWAAPRFARQTLHEFARQTLTKSAWARAHYAQLRARGNDHHAALRALAFKWTRIIWRCWQDRTHYDEARDHGALRRRRSPLAGLIPMLAENAAPS